MPTYYTNINLNKNELQNAVIQNLGTAPGTPVEGQLYYDTATDTVEIRGASAWKSLLYADGLAGGQTLYGGTAVSENLILGSTSNATKGYIDLQDTTRLTTSATTTFATTDIQFVMRDPTGNNDELRNVQPTGTASASTFLRGDGTWATPAGGFANFNMDADSGGPTTIASGDTIDIAGGSGIVTSLADVTSTTTITVALDINSLTPTAIADGDFIPFWDVTATADNKKILFQDFEAALEISKMSDAANYAALADNETVGGNWTFSNVIVNNVTPTLDTHLVNKGYVDSVASGLDVKDSVVCNSTTTSTEGTGYTYTATGGTSGRGQITWTTGPTTIDGVTLTNGDRILNSETGAAGGIWVRTAQNTWDRAEDFDEDAEVTAGAFTFVEEGTTWADTGWVLTTNDPITIGGGSGTSLTWAQFSGAGTYSATDGVKLTGSQFTLDLGELLTSDTAIGLTDTLVIDDGTTKYITWQNAQDSITRLGTITTGVWNGTAITEANIDEAEQGDGVTPVTRITRKYWETIGNAAATQFDLTHGLVASRNVVVEVFRTASPYDKVYPEIEHLSTTQTRIIFSSNDVPGTDEFTVVIIG